MVTYFSYVEQVGPKVNFVVVVVVSSPSWGGHLLLRLLQAFKSNHKTSIILDMNVFKWISTVYYHLKIIMSWRHALDLDVYIITTNRR